MLDSIIFYVLIAAAVSFPAIIRRSLVLRVLCILFLAFMVVFYSGLIFGLHRQLLEQGVQHYHVAEDNMLPDDFKVAVGIVDDLENQNRRYHLCQMFAALAALGVLAVIPLSGGFQFRKKTPHDA